VNQTNPPAGDYPDGFTDGEFEAIGDEKFVVPVASAWRCPLYAGSATTTGLETFVSWRMSWTPDARAETAPILPPMWRVLS
jgi:hypothetical protein